MSWTRDLALSLDDADRRPLFQRIAEGVVGAVQRGRLAAGARLPGSRALAASLGVHRNTVLAAYAELAAQGWIERAQGRGTFVSGALPEITPGRAPGARAGVPARPGFALAPHAARGPHIGPAPEGALSLAGAVPDVSLAPAADLARAYRRVLRRPGRALLAYGHERGHPRLRAALAEMLNALRGLAAGPDDVLVTRGSQQALYLAARAIVRPGDCVAVEALGYPPAWEAFRAAGARLVPVPVDARGLRVERLRALCARRRLRAVYVTPHHQYPTAVSLAAERRLELLALAGRHGFAVVEDDYDHEVHFEGRPILPLASADASGSVVYVGTLSKVLAPGVRTGYAVAPRPLLDRMLELRRAVDRQGDPALECAIAELLEDGIVQRHARRMCRVARSRRDALAQALVRELGDAVSFRLPSGGMALWVAVGRGLDVEAWAQRAQRSGVYFPTARAFAFDRRPRPFARLAFTALDEARLVEAVSRLRAALPARPAATLRRSRRP